MNTKFGNYLSVFEAIVLLQLGRLQRVVSADEDGLVLNSSGLPINLLSIFFVFQAKDAGIVYQFKGVEFRLNALTHRGRG